MHYIGGIIVLILFIALYFPCRYKTAWHEMGHIMERTRLLGSQNPVTMELRKGKKADFLVWHLSQRHNAEIIYCKGLIRGKKYTRGYTSFDEKDEALFTDDIIKRVAAAGVKIGLIYDLFIGLVCFCAGTLYVCLIQRFCPAGAVSILIFLRNSVSAAVTGLWIVNDIFAFLCSSDYRLCRNPESYFCNDREENA